MIEPMRNSRSWIALLACLAITQLTPAADDATYDPAAAVIQVLEKMDVRSEDSPQLGRSPYRNNVSDARNIATDWDVARGQNIKWWAKLGSQTYSSPVIANGKVFIGTNNASGYVKRFPSQVDLGVLLCFDADSGKVLWQHSSPKLPTGRSHDVPHIGICSSACVDGQRLWCVTNRNELCCLDTEGFHDGENDGPFQGEPNQNPAEADIVWTLDLMEQFGAAPHNASVCSVAVVGERLFCTTSNGVREGHIRVANRNTPSFVAVEKGTGRVLWTDNSPGANVLHGQWTSPAYGAIGGVPQVLFAGGDGWLYSFDPAGDNGHSKLLWKFDCNPKTSVYRLERATRNPLLASPVIYNGLVYIGVGEDPEHGEGAGHLWCIDPKKRGDVSPTIVYNKRDPTIPIPHKRVQACEPDKGDYELPNVNSAVVWHYEGSAPTQFEKTMHRTVASAAIKDDLLFVCDISGLVHCVDARTGKEHWTHDILSASWSTALIVRNHVYIADQDGRMWIFQLSKEKRLISLVEMETPVSHSAPVVAGGVLFVATSNALYAVAEGARPKSPAKSTSIDAK